MAIRERATRAAARTELTTPPPGGQSPEPPPKRELWPWLLVLLLLVLAGVAAIWYATRDSGAARTKQQTQLTTVATAAPAKPKPKKQHRQTTQTVVQVSVPDVVGQQRDDAVRTLEAAGLKANVNDVPSDQEKDVVVAQAPRGGAKVASDSAVTLNVSKGKAKPKPAKPVPTTVTVPNVVGDSEGAARDAVKAAGLDPSTQHVPSTDPKGTVVSQSPSGGTTAHQGDGVLLNLSDGPPRAKAKPAKHVSPPSSRQPATATVPSVVGEDEATATSDIQSAGFTVATVDQPTSDPSQDGIVIDQSPPSGTVAAPNSAVTIYVGRYSSG